MCELVNRVVCCFGHLSTARPRSVSHFNLPLSHCRHTSWSSSSLLAVRKVRPSKWEITSYRPSPPRVTTYFPPQQPMPQPLECMMCVCVSALDSYDTTTTSTEPGGGGGGTEHRLDQNRADSVPERLLPRYQAVVRWSSHHTLC